MKALRWVLAATLICGIGVFSSCNKDNNSVGGNVISPMPYESDIIGNWKITNVTEGSIFYPGEFIEIRSDHFIHFEKDNNDYWGTWSLKDYDFHAIGMTEINNRYVFNLRMYLTKEKNIEVVGEIVQYHFNDEWHDHVHFILERVE